MRGPPDNTPKIVTITPEDAMHMLESNETNRPLNDQHVRRIARQHRLWAIIEAKMPVETIVVRGIEPEAFATIDTLRKPRSGADVLALLGATHHRVVLSTALQWLTRWQRKCLEEYRAPKNRIENSDVELAFRDNPGMARAAASANKLRGLANPGLIAFFYFILTNRKPDLAERMMATLENPAGVGINDPFFRLRGYFASDKARKDPLTTIALMVKAANAAHRGTEVRVLSWRTQGSFPEPFPTLDVGHYDSTQR